MTTIADTLAKGLDGRVALVTGASSGLGCHFARVLARHGAKVVIAARRLDRLVDLEQEIGAAGGTAAAVVMDVTDTASVAAAFDAAEQRFGPVDILVNNAGVPSYGWFTDITDEHWRQVMDVNLDGVFRVSREGARRMKAAGNGGAIVMIASILGLGVLKTLTPYAVTKAGVIQMTKAMALELARDRIRVNALAPGYFSTELNGDYLESEAGQRLRARVPAQRFGTLDELDGPLLLLCSDAGSFMTGSILTVDGGHAMAMG
jgi:NAD(P)-dependent dehydrogenase (short-subunit alcohol dehydrogenase family)